MNRNDAGSPADRVVAIIPSAGAGLRMGGPVPKQFLDIDGKPILALTLEVFERCGAVDSVYLVVPERNVDSCRREIVEAFGFEKVAGVVPGGDTRLESVRLGMEAAAGFDFVVVHDGVRPLVTSKLIQEVLEAARKGGAATAAVQARDTVKEVENGLVRRTFDRRKIWLAQTPQAFQYTVLMDAHQWAEKNSRNDFTDDASVVEGTGAAVAVVPGDERNIKVTTPGDMALLRFLTGKEGGRGGAHERGFHGFEAGNP